MSRRRTATIISLFAGFVSENFTRRFWPVQNLQHAGLAENEMRDSVCISTVMTQIVLLHIARARAETLWDFIS